jgi:tRNA(fMet)-specific endonuclease VapC
MNAVVVDTDVVSFLFKGHSSASLYAADLTGRVLVISFMTLAELERWPIQAQWGEARRNRLQEYLAPFALMPWDRTLCTVWAKVMTGAQARGFRIDCADAWIAATALLYQVPLVTHNRDDYRGVDGLTVSCYA